MHWYLTLIPAIYFSHKLYVYQKLLFNKERCQLLAQIGIFESPYAVFKIFGYAILGAGFSAFFICSSILRAWEIVKSGF
jgi:hypothetical protein